jgi:6-phosphogluconolactonase (cycloisomerase 2 family)
VGHSPSAVAFSPTADLLAEANGRGHTVVLYRVDARGRLRGGETRLLEAYPSALAFSPNGALLAVTDYDNGAVSVLSVGSGGRLQRTPGSPFAAGGYPDAVAFSPNGHLLAVANEDDYNVSLFSVTADGALAPLPGSPLPTGADPVSVAFSPSGGLLAVADYEGAGVTIAALGPGGAPAGESMLATGGSPSSVAFRPSLLAFDSSLSPPGPPSWSAPSPDGAELAVATGGRRSAILLYAVGADGVATGPPARMATGAHNAFPRLAFDPAGTLLANVGSARGVVTVFAVAPAGTLTPIAGSPFRLGPHADPLAVAFDRTGRTLAVADYGTSALSLFSVRR